MKARRKRLNRERGSGMSFGELVRKLWQPEPEGLGRKAPPEKQQKSATEGKRKRKI
jgi:hypothetical protein